MIRYETHIPLMNKEKPFKERIVTIAPKDKDNFIVNLHQNLELLYLIEGDIEVITNGVSVRLDVGDIAVVNASYIHDIFYHSNSRFYFIIINTDFLSEFGIKIDKVEFNRLVRSEKAKKLIERVGLSDKTYNYPCQLSGGQQQRVAIARALALEPDILCFDEPTSALDPELTGEVLRVIRDLKSADSTMIVVTHEMEFARSVSDKVMFMADGIIEEFGTPDEVFGNPKSQKTRNFLMKDIETNEI